jgi:MFS family permease
MKPTSWRDALNPSVIKLGLVSFFADVSSEMLYPITPIFLTTVLGASAFDVGLIEGFAEGVASLLKTYSGAWSDRLQKRKTFVWLGYLLTALAKPLVGIAGSWPQVLLARGLDRFGKGIRSAPRDALLAEAVPTHLRGAAFGWHRMMDTLGAALGPVLAICFLSSHATTSEGLRHIYFLALIPGLIAVAFVFTVHEDFKPVQAASSAKNLVQGAWSPKFKRYLWAWAIFSAANSSDVFLLLKAQKSGVSLTTTIWLYAFYSLLYALASPYLGQLSDRIGRKIILIFGLAIFAFVYVFFGLAHELWQFWILFGVYGLYMAATDGVGKALAVDLVPKERKATGVGLLGTVTGLATIFASAAAGFLWDHAGAEWTFFYGAGGAVIASFLLLLL